MSAVVPRKIDVNGKGLVEKAFFSADVDQLYEVFSFSHCEFIEFAAVNPWVNEGPEPHVGQVAGFVAGYVPEKLGDYTLWKVIGQDSVGPD